MSFQQYANESLSKYESLSTYSLRDSYCLKNRPRFAVVVVSRFICFCVIFCSFIGLVYFFIAPGFFQSSNNRNDLFTQ